MSDPADPKPGIGRGCDDGHQVAVLGRAHLTIGFLPRLPGWHEDDSRTGPNRDGNLTRCHKVASGGIGSNGASIIPSRRGCVDAVTSLAIYRSAERSLC